MISVLRSETYKLLSIRSTYIIIILATAFAAFMSFYVEGYKASGSLLDSHKYVSVVVVATQLLSLLFSVIAIFHITNEYRHNTITYTLTAVNSRTKVLLAKIISISLLSIVLSFLIIAVVTLGTYLGLQLSNVSLPPQDFPVLSTLGQVLFYNLALTLFAMLIAVIVRSIVGAIVIILLGVNLVEGLLSIILKDNAIYLPFRSLSFIFNNTSPEGEPVLKPIEAATIFTVYLVVGWLIAWFLFLKRDAN